MNESQLAAAHSESPWVLVNAGPGSGKTKTLIERAKFIQQRGMMPKDMAFVTFTNVGANVMRKRLREALGDAPGFVGTLHALMMRFLLRENPNIAMVGEDDAAEFLSRSASLLGYKGSKSKLAEVSGQEEPTGDAGRVVRHYRQTMRDLGLVDYNMVLTEGLKALRRVANPFPCWFVDEFQDSANIDASIYMQASPGTLFIVADADQSIFGFRGACPDNILHFAADPRFAVRTLEENYRCDEAICGLANTVISQNKSRYPKKTVSKSGEAGQVTGDKYADETEELKAVSDVARQFALARGPEQVAVLCRTNETAKNVTAMLLRNGIPVSTMGGEPKPKDWRLLMMILQQITKPNNWASAIILAREIAKARKESAKAAEDTFTAHRFAQGTIQSFFHFPSPEVVLSMNANFSAYGVGKVAMQMMADRIRRYSPESLGELLDLMAEDMERKSTGGVSVLTVHAAKGEEWDSVILPGLDQYRRDQAEERRLLFVAITRARHSLHLSQSNSRTIKTPAGIITQEPPKDGAFSIVESYLLANAAR